MRSLEDVSADSQFGEAGATLVKRGMRAHRVFRERRTRTAGYVGIVSSFLLGIPFWLNGEDLGSPPLRRESSYSRTTLLLCNQRVPESVALAEYYAAARQIPARNVLRISVDPSEEISRAVYETKIAGPLREMLLRQGWWMPERDPVTARQTLRSQFHCLVLFRGMPLKIRAAQDQEPILQSSAASVDSELSTFGRPGSASSGPLKNPYFQSEVPFAQAGLSNQLVGRIDGPSVHQCRQMIDDSVRAESEGLWGNAYIDFAQESDSGLDRLQTVAGRLRDQGIPVTVNRFRQSFPIGYPMRDPAFYFGSKQEEVGGVFEDAEFRFRPGAIAAHLSDSCASTIRDAKKSWAAALLNRGAAAVVGNVANPDASLYYRLDLLMDRLSKGFTLAESASMASESMSWMGIVLGDPLYRPFTSPGEKIDDRQYAKDDMLPYKVIRLAYGCWGPPVPPEDLVRKLEMASAKLPLPELIEHLGLLASEMGNFRDARTHFMRARNQYSAREDQLRMDLHLANLAWAQNDKLKARNIWLEAADAFRDIPAGKAPQEFMKVFQTAQQ